MNAQQFQETVTRVVEDIVTRYPDFPRPHVIVNTDIPGEYNQSTNVIKISESGWVKPEFTERELSTVIAHELGHWHDRFANPVWFEKQLKEETLARMLFNFIGGSEDEYRVLPLERSADKFAVFILGYEVDQLELKTKYMRLNSDKWDEDGGYLGS